MLTNTTSRQKKQTMKHIETKSDIEKRAKTDYAVLKPGDPVVATEEVEQTARDLLRVLRELDEKELEASRLRGILMNAMKHSATLKAKDGTILCTWKEGNITKNVDYNGLLKLYNVKADDIAKFTNSSRGSRRFSLELE